ncbi:rab-GTPase-TBC domain-containing protein [Pavlovales sp. CCMP2436]|nr:rab-GTPase-TBC domain-containing protein [Pavlovales sp. CCMP2436]
MNHLLAALQSGGAGRSLGAMPWSAAPPGLPDDDPAPLAPPPPPPPRQTPEQRVRACEAILSAEVIDLRALRELAFSGVPEVPGNRLRACAWKLLLGYLPTERSAWESTLELQRRSYHEWKSELMVDPSKRTGGGDPLGAAAAVAPDAHPLTSAAGSEWNAYFQNEELFSEIEKDVSRTLPDYGFYSSETCDGLEHRTAILQILFVYAKLNPGIRYVQGMNELLAPIYYLFVNESVVVSQLARARSEALTEERDLLSDGQANLASGAAVGDLLGGSPLQKPVTELDKGMAQLFRSPPLTGGGSSDLLGGLLSPESLIGGSGGGTTGVPWHSTGVSMAAAAADQAASSGSGGRGSSDLLVCILSSSPLAGASGGGGSGGGGGGSDLLGESGGSGGESLGESTPLAVTGERSGGLQGCILSPLPLTGGGGGGSSGSRTTGVPMAAAAADQAASGGGGGGGSGGGTLWASPPPSPPSSPPSSLPPSGSNSGGSGGDGGGAAPAGLEADAFFCFTNLMAETRDTFCQSLDQSDVGVKEAIEQLSVLLLRADPELHAHMASEGVSPQFYSFRWITLLVSQEFDLPDVLRIWDSFFSDEKRFPLLFSFLFGRFALFWCLSMILRVRELLLDGDFGIIIKTLQSYPDPDIEALYRGVFFFFFF